MKRRARPDRAGWLVRGGAALAITAAGLTACSGGDGPEASPSTTAVRPTTTSTERDAPGAGSTTSTSTATSATGATTTSVAVPPAAATTPRTAGAAPAPSTSAPRRSTPPTTSPPAPPAAVAASSTGWQVTVYVTPVERYYGGPPTPVTGCPSLECDRRTPKVHLGTYPADFVRRVKDEGTGLITSGEHAGGYLNWSYDTGYWLDTAPRDSYGNALVPYVSAAADGLPRGTRVRITDCGRNDDGSAPDPQVCAAFQRAEWRINDEFTPGLGGERHIDLYLGAEDRADYTGTSPYWVSLVGASLRY